MIIHVTVKADTDKYNFELALFESKQRRILWLCDIQGWAYYNCAMRFANLMPDFDHIILQQQTRDNIAIIEVIAQARPDILVVQHPWNFNLNRQLNIPMIHRLDCRGFRIWPDCCKELLDNRKPQKPLEQGSSIMSKKGSNSPPPEGIKRPSPPPGPPTMPKCKEPLKNTTSLNFTLPCGGHLQLESRKQLYQNDMKDNIMND